MKKKMYETPATAYSEVELESEFMTGSVEPGDPIKETGGVTIQEQTPGVAIGDGTGLDNSWGSGWDQNN